MEIKINKKDLEKVLRDEIYDQRKRADKLSITNAKSKEECIKRQEIINKYEIMEILFLKLGVTKQIIESPDKLDTIKII